MQSLTHLSLTLRFLNGRSGSLSSRRSRLHLGWWAIAGSLALGLNLVSVTASFAQALQRGAQGSSVQELQTQLQTLGYYDGEIDGIYGSGTEDAVTRFQESRELNADGVAGAATQAALQDALAENAGNSDTSETSDTTVASDQIRQVQSQLQQLGLYQGAIDGISGPATQAAIEQFQRDRELSVDGVVGPATQAALQEAIAAQNAANAGVPAASFNTGGLSTEETVELQSRLQSLGYYQGAIDGVFGAGTVTALRQFQLDRGLPVDGIAGFQTWDTLRNTSSYIPPARYTIVNPPNIPFGTEPPPLSPPSETVNYPITGLAPISPYSSPVNTAYLAGVASPDVQNLQLQLRILGFYKDAIDGIYGDRTRDAVADFQRSQGLYPDGIAGQGTRAALKNWSEAVGAGTFPVGGVYTGPFSVLELQKRLRARGFYTGPLDGRMNSQMQAAVQQAQTYYGLPPIDIYSGRF